MQTVKQNCKKCRQEFVLDSNDLGFYEKMKVPAPKVCPDCRFKMRAVWRNETTLYSGQKCNLCNKNIVTMYNPKLPYNIFCYECYISDSWNPGDFAKNYDKNISFFKQFGNLYGLRLYS